MIQVFAQDIKTQDRQSSKGNQLKWYNNNTWYKADASGYEGLAEYIISYLLKFSTLQPSEYVLYQTESISYNTQIFTGCKSLNFIPEGWQLFTLERIFSMKYNQSLYESIFHISTINERIKFLVDTTVSLTGLQDFGIYLSKMLCLDAFFLNEDRHMHNIAVLMDTSNQFHYCPFFDNGAALLSDTNLDYPLHTNVQTLLKTVSSKTISTDFDEQLDAIESLYGQHLKIFFALKDIESLLNSDENYSPQIKIRILEIISLQKHKYQHLF
ncbi:MAG: hypothetical protein R3Y24_11995 [Eubacteriales bacterium]